MLTPGLDKGQAEIKIARTNINNLRYADDTTLMTETVAEEAEVERVYEDLQDLLELTPKKDVLFIIGARNAKVGSQETP